MPKLNTRHNKAETPTVNTREVTIELQTGKAISPAVSRPLTYIKFVALPCSKTTFINKQKTAVIPQ